MKLFLVALLLLNYGCKFVKNDTKLQEIKTSQVTFKFNLPPRSVENKSRPRLLKKTRDFGGWAGADIGGASQFDCFAVAAFWDVASPQVSNCIDTNNSTKLLANVVSASAPLGGSITLNIPVGPSRVFSLLAFQSIDGVCRSLDSLDPSELTLMSSPQIVGGAVANLSKAQETVDISASIVNAQKLFSCSGGSMSWSPLNTTSIQSVVINASTVEIFGDGLDGVNTLTLDQGGKTTVMDILNQTNNQITLAASTATAYSIKAALNFIASTALGDVITAVTFTDLGSAASLNVGIGASNVVQLDANASLPAVDASNLLNLNPTESCCRLSLSSTEPVPVTDINQGTIVYFHPYKGDRISLYDSSVAGGDWSFYQITSPISFDASTLPLVASTNYDVFLYDSGAGNLALDLEAWTSNNTRNATNDLFLVDGVNVMISDFTKRYLGTLRTMSGANQFTDTKASRLLWNVANKVERAFSNPNNSGTNWTCSATSAAPLLAFGSGKMLEAVVGLPVTDVIVKATAFTPIDTYTERLLIGICVDPGTLANNATSNTPSSGANGTARAELQDTTTIGYHQYAMICSCVSFNTSTCSAQIGGNANWNVTNIFGSIKN